MNKAYVTIQILVGDFVLVVKLLRVYFILWLARNTDIKCHMLQNNGFSKTKLPIPHPPDTTARSSQVPIMYNIYNHYYRHQHITNVGILLGVTKLSQRRNIQ